MSQPQIIGIVGGGQLAHLMCEAARPLGLQTVVLSPDEQAVARESCDEFICAAMDDLDALQRLAEQTDLVTLDTEHVPIDSLLHLEKFGQVAPGSRFMSQINDRLAQRGLLTRLNLPQTRFWSVDDPEAVAVAQSSAVFPAVLKTRHGGYDGLGQQRVAEAEELADAWKALEERPCVLEAWLDDVREFSIVGGRGSDGSVRLYPAIENLHSGGQLQFSQLPFELPQEALEEARNCWTKLANSLDLHGVMAVEFFIDAHNEIWINEIAPRVHNSGHLTQLAYDCSQFEMHMRAVSGMPLPELGEGRPSVMLNLYPEQGMTSAEAAAQLEAEVGGRMIWYGKTPRPRRKMGHWLLQPELAQAAQAALAAKAG